MAHAYVLWSLNVVLLSLILFRGSANRMLTAYPVFYGYVAFVLGAAVLQLLVAAWFGIGTAHYYYSFHLTNLFIPLLQLLVLWDVFVKLAGGEDRRVASTLARVAAFMGVAAAPVVWEMVHAQVDFFTGWHLTLVFVQVLGCLGVYRRVLAQKRVEPGANLKGILAGISIMVALQAVNFALYVSRSEAFEIFSFFAQFFYLAALIVFFRSLWNFEPARGVEPKNSSAAADELRRADRVNLLLNRLLRRLLLPR